MPFDTSFDPLGLIPTSTSDCPIKGLEERERVLEELPEKDHQVKPIL